MALNFNVGLPLRILNISQRAIPGGCLRLDIGALHSRHVGGKASGRRQLRPDLGTGRHHEGSLQRE
jgi:hypothetical protein